MLHWIDKWIINENVFPYITYFNNACELLLYSSQFKYGAKLWWFHIVIRLQSWELGSYRFWLFGWAHGADMGEHWWLLESGRWLRLLALEERVSSAPHSWLQNRHCLECLLGKQGIVHHHQLYIIMNCASSAIVDHQELCTTTKLRCPLQCGPSDDQLGKVTPGKDLPWSAPGHAGPKMLLSSLWYPTRASPSQWSTVPVHKNYLSSCIKQQLTLRDFCFLLVTW